MMINTKSYFFLNNSPPTTHLTLNIMLFKFMILKLLVYPKKKQWKEIYCKELQFSSLTALTSSSLYAIPAVPNL